MAVESNPSGWIPTGFQSVVVLWVWLFLVLAHAVFRSWTGSETDPIRPSGPLE